MIELDQPSLLDWRKPEPLPFGGATYAAELDESRLGAQLATVLRVMASGAWFTPQELEEETGFNWASISARIRDVRKPEFYIPFQVERERLSRGLFRYRLVRPT